MMASQRLYRLSMTRYIQHAEGAPMAGEIEEYCVRSRGEPPPYIPLPRGPVTFRIAREGCRSREVTWDGTGALPREVLNYVVENGTLPTCHRGKEFQEEETLSVCDYEAAASAPRSF